MLERIFWKVCGGWLLMVVGCHNLTENNQPDFKLKIEGGPALLATDFYMYDSSTQILYFNRLINDLEDHIDRPIFFEYQHRRIWEGTLRSSQYDYLCEGTYALLDAAERNRFYLYLVFPRQDKNKTALATAFKECSLLHGGTQAVLSKLQYQNQQIIAHVTVINTDIEPLMILDMDKMGSKLFHYFTTGVEIAGQNEIFPLGSTLPAGVPQPWDGWSPQWLTPLQPGEKKTFKVTYPKIKSLPKGAYVAQFTFPGLGFQVSPLDLWQPEGRIWLGEGVGSNQVAIQAN